MKKILVTAFDPFGGEKINPALSAVMLLPDEVHEVGIIKQELPTIYGKSFDVLLPIIEREQPDAVISVGQAGGRSNISVERIAINIDDATTPDNDGIVRTDQQIIENGPAAYFSTLPIKAITHNLHKAEIPASVSNTAGTFVCNHIMYSVLHYAATKQPKMKVGFVHVPYLPVQTLTKPTTPSMSLENIVAGLKLIMQATVKSIAAQ